MAKRYQELPVGNRWLGHGVSHATPCGATRSVMSAMTFSNATVYTSRATSRGVAQLLVAPRSLARPKGLILVGWVIFKILL
jgi:hypothetical protein